MPLASVPRKFMRSWDLLTTFPLISRTVNCMIKRDANYYRNNWEGTSTGDTIPAGLWIWTRVILPDLLPSRECGPVRPESQQYSWIFEKGCYIICQYRRVISAYEVNKKKPDLLPVLRILAFTTVSRCYGNNREVFMEPMSYHSREYVYRHCYSWKAARR